MLFRTLRLAISLVVAAAIPLPTALALIEGGEGNEPIRDSGWPAGAAAVFNNPSRVAHWVGPPYGGGQWHAECRGNTLALNVALLNFAKVDAKTKRLVVRDGIGRSFWLNRNNEPAKKDAAKIDWVFKVWQLDVWKQLRNAPADIRPRDLGDDDSGPPVQINVFTGGGIRWADVRVPQGIEVVDERLEAHGFSLEDGTVFEGTVTNLATKKPIAARVDLQLIERRAKGGYEYTTKSQAAADENGRWVLKNAPEGWHRIVISSDGYVPRIIGYAQLDGQPGWHSYNGAMSLPAVVTGHVADDTGKSLADVRVRLMHVACEGEQYESLSDYSATTDPAGKFRIDDVPHGTARASAHKRGYCQVGLGPSITTPTKDVSLTMPRSAQLRVTVDFGGAKRPDEYIVELEPEGGNVVGSWGGSSSIDAGNTVAFSDAPPGHYVVWGHPNPYNETQKTKRIPIELKGGAIEELTLPATRDQ